VIRSAQFGQFYFNSFFYFLFLVGYLFRSALVLTGMFQSQAMIVLWRKAWMKLN